MVNGAKQALAVACACLDAQRIAGLQPGGFGAAVVLNFQRPLVGQAGHALATVTVADRAGGKVDCA